MRKLLHFTADWCGPCKKIKPIVEEFILENPDIEYVAIDVDVDFQKAEEFHVLSIPTLISMDGSAMLSRWTGVADKTVVENLFKKS